MKNIIVLAILATSIMACKSKKNSVEMISLNFTSTQDYCGGADPPEELINELNTPKPFTGILYLNQNPIPETRLLRDIKVEFKNGKAKIPKIEQGTYLVFLYPFVSEESISKLQENENNRFDPGCLMMKNEMIFQQLEILPTTKSITSEIRLICDPCLEPAQ